MKKSAFTFLIITALLGAVFSNAQTSVDPVVTHPAPAEAPATDSSATDKKAEKPEIVNGSVMYASKDFIDNMSNNESLTTFHKIVNKAGLSETLKGKGDFTVFAPTTEAFQKVGKAKMDSMMVSHRQNDLTALLTYHIVSGRLNLKDLVKSIRRNDGKSILTTVSGSPLTVTLENEQLILTDETGNRATITQADINQKNGTLYLIDHVLMPKSKV